MTIEPIKKGACKDLPTSEFVVHKCQKCGRITKRYRSVAGKDHKCQLCLQDKFNNLTKNEI